MQLEGRQWRYGFLDRNVHNLGMLRNFSSLRSIFNDAWCTGNSIVIATPELGSKCNAVDTQSSVTSDVLTLPIRFLHYNGKL